MTLNEMIYLKIKERLFEMNYGDFLSIRQCAIEYGISYTPVRQAFLRLQEEGLLRNIPNVGYFVQKPDYLDFQAIFQVRICIEPFALTQVFDRITAEDIAHLEQIHQRIEYAIENGHWEDTLELDIAFHQFFLDKLHNVYLGTLYQTVRERYQRLLVKNLSEFNFDSAFIDKDTYDHLPLIEAIRSKDKMRSVNILREHILCASERMCRSTG